MMENCDKDSEGADIVSKESEESASADIVVTECDDGVMVDGVKLDAWEVEVLRAVVMCGGEALTGDVKEVTGLDHNEKVLRRFKKLEDAELLETMKTEWDRAIPAPTKACVTVKGENVMDSLDGDADIGEDLGERVDRLEDMVRGLQREVAKLTGGEA